MPSSELPFCVLFMITRNVSNCGNYQLPSYHLSTNYERSIAKIFLIRKSILKELPNSWLCFSGLYPDTKTRDFLNTQVINFQKLLDTRWDRDNSWHESSNSRKIYFGKKRVIVCCPYNDLNNNSELRKSYLLRNFLKPY